MKRKLILKLVTATCGFMMLGACAGEVTYRTYDPYYRDYHVWSGVEAPYYNNWVIETHRPHVEYRRLHRRDREEYWRWRHDHR